MNIQNLHIPPRVLHYSAIHLQTCNRRFVMRVIYFIARKVEKLHKYIFTNCCTCNSCMLIVVVGIALIQSFIVIGITTSL